MNDTVAMSGADAPQTDENNERPSRGPSNLAPDSVVRRNFWPLIVMFTLVSGTAGIVYWLYTKHQTDQLLATKQAGNTSSKEALESAGHKNTEQTKKLGVAGEKSSPDMAENVSSTKAPQVPAIERDYKTGNASAAAIPVQDGRTGQPPVRSRFDASSSFETNNGMSGFSGFATPANSYNANLKEGDFGANRYSIPPVTPPASTPAPAASAAPAAFVPPNKATLNLNVPKTGKAQAAMIGNRDFLMAKGVLIDCDLETAIDSSLPGMVRCTTIKDTYSDNGRVVLIGRGSTVTGEYQSVTQNGQTRLQVIWDRIKTPEGVVIEPASPATDSLGRAGLDGDVDNHWWQRVGSAFLLSTIKDVIAAKTASGSGSTSGSTSNAVYQNSVQNTNQMATEVLKSNMNIPPTITRPQGSRVEIFLARDLDFSEVYHLKSVGPSAPGALEQEQSK